MYHLVHRYMDKRFTMAVVFLTFAKVNTTMETGQGNKSSPFPFPYPKSKRAFGIFLGNAFDGVQVYRRRTRQLKLTATGFRKNENRGLVVLGQARLDTPGALHCVIVS